MLVVDQAFKDADGKLTNGRELALDERRVPLPPA
jgi:hypothetical protein